MTHQPPVRSHDYFYKAGDFAKSAVFQMSSAERAEAERRVRVRAALAAMLAKIQNDQASPK